MRPLLTLAAVLTLSAMTLPAFADTAQPDQSQANLPITRVSLYTSGVGYFERDGTVDGSESETLLFPVDQVNDILKSLVLLDLGGGTIEPVTYAAQDPLAKELQSYSVDLSDSPDRATLLGRLRGTQVKVTVSAAGSMPMTGTILGVESKTITLQGGATTTQESLNLISDDGLTSIDLDSIQSIQFLDAKLNSEITSALAQIASGRDASKRAINLNFDGSGKRNVSVAYVTSTPLWQTSYRLVMGDKPTIQGWALVQNTSEDDWSNIHLTLTSGRPISFIQDLYTPIYVPRQTIESQIASAPAPQLYGNDQLAATADMPVAAQLAAPAQSEGGGGFGGAFFARAGSNTNGVMGALANPYNDMNVEQAFAKSIASSGATLGQSLFSYVIQVPVTIPRSQSAMIPFLGSEVTASRVSIYNSSVLADHPLSGVRMINTTKLHLMGGPVTVFDQQQGGGTGYVGDAEISDTEPGESRLFSFAVDLGVDASSKPGDSFSIERQFTIDKGTLIIRQVTQTNTIYTFKNNSQSLRSIVLENPITNGYKLVTPEKPDEQTSDVYRFNIPLDAGAHKDFTVTQEHTDFTDYGLIDMDETIYLSIVQEGDLSQTVKDAMATAFQKRHAIADTQSQINAVQAQIAAISTDQDRIRKNMNALDKSSALYKRYVGELNDQETQLDDLNTKLANLNTQLAAQQADLSAYISNLTVN